jgi:DNA-binding transcriptional ArsR family regulator
MTAKSGNSVSGDELAGVLAALAHPQRIRIIAALEKERSWVSGLARTLGLGRPLVHMHLQRLEAAGLVTSTLELSSDGKAMRFFDVAPFKYRLTPEVVARAAATLTVNENTSRRKK